ncbi:hypothetical protein [Chitinimonas koreensis]|uniref:hypothetical protein n=1 Tax=Chitinimonas koreensis TaxID=356302 RepID=UPI0004258C53|nr:hypothetical protein [Chitinimonas koreensis]QNM97457.1 hypothetical protein H9L41_03880 [Chitinimonas koreensis]
MPAIRRRAAQGLLLSLALHGLLFYFLPPPAEAPRGRAPTELQVSLRPPAAIAPAVSPPSPPSPPPRAESARRPQHAARPALAATLRSPAATAAVPAAEPAAPAVATPSLDVEALRAEVRRQARADGRARAESLPSALRADRPERETALGRSMAEAARPDCRTAYAGAGLLAALPLLKDAATGSGCKW